MNQDIVKGQWRQVQGEAKKTFGKLTDDDWQVVGGHIDSFVGKVQERYGITREQASDQVRRFADGMRNDYPDTYNSWYGDASNDVERAANNFANSVERTANNVGESMERTVDSIANNDKNANRTY